VEAAAESTTADARTMRAAATAFGVPERAPETADLIVDALFGSGFRGRLEGAAEALVARANGLAAPIVALDVPSGVDGASGRVDGIAIQAALTLAFHGRTVGSAIEPGRGCAGDVVELPIGLPIALAGPERAVRMEPADLALVPSRSPTGSKYDAGGVLVVGGASGMSGAPALAALAAFRAGAGVVWVCVPESEHAAVAAHAPELMVHGELDPERVLELAARARAVVAGPGLGRAPAVTALVDALVRGVEAPLVLDADALFALAGRLETLAERAGPTALTPHAGELGRLLGRDSAAIGDARLASVSEAAERSGAAVLLKGPDTLVAAPGEPLRVVETAVPQLATAGAGDVLAGAAGALCARGLPPAQALALAAVAHGSAARLAVSELGAIIATDLLLPLGRLLA
jgi:NAD(P)H-hydrate epimerase